MSSEEGNTAEKPKLKTQKSVQIVDTKPQIVEVREKHGLLYNAIPKMPIGMAVFCCLLNIVIPGFGTLLSAFTVFCGCTTLMNKRLPAFLLNLVSAFLQMISFILIVGWVWSILWGMNMVSLASKYFMLIIGWVWSIFLGMNMDSLDSKNFVPSDDHLYPDRWLGVEHQYGQPR